jgi:hypothetical protein
MYRQNSHPQDSMTRQLGWRPKLLPRLMECSCGRYFVVKRLNIDLEYERTEQDLEETLRIVPLFESLFADLRSGSERSKSVAIIQWILLAARPLKMQELRHALAGCGETPISDITAWETGGDSLPTDPERFLTSIRAYTRGLGEMTLRPKRMCGGKEAFLKQTRKRKMRSLSTIEEGSQAWNPIGQGSGDHSISHPAALATSTGQFSNAAPYEFAQEYPGVGSSGSTPTVAHVPPFSEPIKRPKYAGLDLRAETPNDSANDTVPIPKDQLLSGLYSNMPFNPDIYTTPTDTRPPPFDLEQLYSPPLWSPEHPSFSPYNYLSANTAAASDIKLTDTPSLDVPTYEDHCLTDTPAVTYTPGPKIPLGRSRLSLQHLQAPDNNTTDIPASNISPPAVHKSSWRGQRQKPHKNPSENPPIQFTHESVREFFLRGRASIFSKHLLMRCQSPNGILA